MSAFDLLDAMFLRTNIVLLTLALLFSLVAARGFRGTRWGRVLRPLPVVAGGFLVGMLAASLPIGPGLESLLVGVSWAPAVVAVALSAFEYRRLDHPRPDR